MTPCTHPLIDHLRRQPVPWLPADAATGNVALSSRVRLARNLEGFAFPNRLTSQERRRVQMRVADAAGPVPGLGTGWQAELGSLSPAQRDLLVERRLIEGDLAAGLDGQAILLSADESISVAVNEQDHLRLWAVRPGLELRRLWHDTQHLEEQLAATLTFAFQPRLGYLTARPHDVGTGLRAAVLMHLPGLAMADQIRQVREALDGVAMTMESVFYDDERPLGNLFEIANGEALGSSEESLLDRVQRVAGDLVAQERHARQRLAHDHPDVLADAVGRAYGTLRFGYRLDAAEAVGMLSALRLGLDLGMIETLDTAALNRLLMLTQPGHLAAETGRELEPDEIDRVRADTMRLHLRHADRQAPGKG